MPEYIDDPRDVDNGAKRLTQAYILGNGKVVSAESFVQNERFKAASRAVSKKMEADTKGSAVLPTREKNGEFTEVEPPYDPSVMAAFLDADEIHSRCCKVKITDAIGRDYKIVPVDDSVDKTTMEKEKKILEDFFRTCNRYNRFIGTFTEAGIDHESIGYGFVEIIRSMDKKVVKIQHRPAERIKVLDGFRGFVEYAENGGRKYYQPFGGKVVSTARSTADGYEPFDISLDGDWGYAQWNLKAKEDYHAIGPEELGKACNELIYIPKYSTRSVHYGVPDFIPAVGYIMANINIRDFLLQFFDHNTIPQYAVIVKGADLNEEVKSLIQNYFSKNVKGQDHSTLVIPIPEAGEVEVTFERLENSMDSASYNEIRKANQVSIMTAHGVSPAIIGITEAASLGSGKGTAQMENYKERLVIPYQKRWSEEMNQLIRMGLGLGKIKIQFNPNGVEDAAQMLASDREAMTEGLMTVNEVRRRNNLGPPLKGGDIPFVSSGGNVFPLGNLESAPQSGKLIEEMS